jgi:putative heme-binding domain-containing protein
MKLSETGLFKDVKEHEPADGVIPFRPNVRQWQDGAWAEHFLALPGVTSVTLFEKPRPLPGQVDWHNFQMQYPKDAVLVKTILLDVAIGKAEIRKRIETQILHYDGEDWRGYTYLWSDDQTDAELAPPDGAEKVFTVATSLSHDREGDSIPSATREQVWTVHSRTQCMTCHNAWSEYTLAFNLRQLNGVHFGNGLTDQNQLVSLTTAGMIQRMSAGNKPLPAYDAASVAKEASLVGRWNKDTNAAARSYLHVNCSHCHRFGGGGGQVVLELDASRPLKETGLLDVIPKQGDFGIAGGRLIAPGEPYRSVLFYRMAKFGRGRMPHLGSEDPDGRGLDLMATWISSLATPPKPWQLARPTTADLDTAFTSFSTAWPFARALASGRFTERGDSIGKKLRSGAEKLEPGLIRDLFEGYLPPDPKGPKLGSNPRPTSILAITGDAKNGEALFFNKEMKCVNCHKVGDKGVSLGPDLTAIGKTRTRAELLESLLQPSVRVEPQFAAYLVQTKDEKTFTGLLVKRDEKQVVLRDAENKEIVLDAANVESVRPSRLSLMPDGQMSGLRPQEAADLLEYLVQRK